MATSKNKKVVKKETEKIFGKGSSKVKKEKPLVVKEENQKEIIKEEVLPKKNIIKKGAEVILTGRCFGASSLECPLKSVRNYKAKIIDINKENNSILIEDGWISRDAIQ